MQLLYSGRIPVVIAILLLTRNLTAAEEGEVFRLRQELVMEREASKLLSQKLLKAYEEKTILENELKEKEERIKGLEAELASVRKLMENEVLSYRKKVGALQQEVTTLQKRIEFLNKGDKVMAYIETLEKEKRRFQEKLAEKEREIDKALATINALKREFLSSKKNVEIVEVPSTEAVPEKKEKNAGKVLTVNKEFGFIIIETGGSDTIKPGKVFQVLRKGNVIGKVEINRIRGGYGFARVIDITSGKNIREGDTLLINQ